ncbi:MAG: c-type cytochrome [bacterium]|jgi:mono/diheme cytochrome c family protein|nr:c-type cytochrome [bacterium]MBK9471198.1 c-type cytochrome [bacterium]MBK9776586.1 c-type cytochrome [bacterium]
MNKPKHRTRTAALVAAGFALIAFGAGCSGGGDTGATGEAKANGAKKVSITGADRKEAHEMFNTRCAACHGQFGRGDGPGAAGLNPKPRNYADAAWQSTVTDEEIEKAIVYGGAAVGKSPQMVANPDLQAKPGVVAALREKVRSFGK